MSREISLLNYRRTPKGVLTNIYQHIKERCSKYKYELGITLSDVHELYLYNQKFNLLYNAWVKNGFKFSDKPSIDRIDPYKGYTVENIQILSCSENRAKGVLEVAIKKHKPIIALDLKGNFIERFRSLKDAAILLNLNQGLISAVLTGKRTHTGGYKFVYENPELLK